MYDWNRINKLLNVNLSYEGDWLSDIKYAQRAFASLARQQEDQPLVGPDQKKRLFSYANLYETLLLKVEDEKQGKGKNKPKKIPLPKQYVTHPPRLNPINKTQPMTAFVETYKYFQKLSSFKRFDQYLDDFVKQQSKNDEMPLACLLRAVVRLFIIYYASRNPSVLRMILVTLEKSTYFVDKLAPSYTHLFMVQFVDLAKKHNIFLQYRNFVVDRLETLYQNKKLDIEIDPDSSWSLDKDYINKNPVYYLISELVNQFIGRRKGRYKDSQSLSAFLDVVSTFVIRLYKKNRYAKVNPLFQEIKDWTTKNRYNRLKGCGQQLREDLEQMRSKRERNVVLVNLKVIEKTLKAMKEEIKAPVRRVKKGSDGLTALLATLHEKYYFACQPDEPALKALFDPYIKRINDQLKLSSYGVKGVPVYNQQRNSCWLSATYRLDAYWNGYKPTDERQFIDQLHVSKQEHQYVLDEWKADKGGPNFFERDKFDNLNLKSLLPNHSTSPAGIPFVPLTPNDLIQHLQTYGPLYVQGLFLSKNNRVVKLREAWRQKTGGMHALCVVGVVSSWFVVVVDSNNTDYREKIIPFYDFVDFLAGYSLQYHRDALRRYNDNRA